MLSDEIAFLKRRLAEIDADRTALIKSIAVLEAAPLLSKSASSVKRGGEIREEANSLAPGNTGLRDAVRRYLREGELPVDEIEKRVDVDFPGLLQSSPRAVDTCLYKL